MNRVRCGSPSLPPPAYTQRKSKKKKKKKNEIKTKVNKFKVNAISLFRVTANRKFKFCVQFFVLFTSSNEKKKLRTPVPIHIQVIGYGMLGNQWIVATHCQKKKKQQIYLIAIRGERTFANELVGNKQHIEYTKKKSQRRHIQC